MGKIGVVGWVNATEGERSRLVTADSKDADSWLLMIDADNRPAEFSERIGPSESGVADGRDRWWFDPKQFIPTLAEAHRLAATLAAEYGYTVTSIIVHRDMESWRKATG